MTGRPKIVRRGSEIYQSMWLSDPSATALIAEGNRLVDSFRFTE